MPIEGEAQRVTVYVGSSDTWQGSNLALAIVEPAASWGSPGRRRAWASWALASTRGLHRAHLLGLSEDLPERIEIVDRRRSDRRALPLLDEMVDGGLIILEDVLAIHYRHHAERPAT